MNSSDIQPFDFRQPNRLADGVERVLSEWQDNGARAIADGWANNVGIATDWGPAALRTIRSSELEEELTTPILAYNMVFKGTEDPMWLLLPRNLATVCVEIMFGESPTEMPEDRELSHVEHSLVELAVQDIVTSLAESQPCANPIACELVGPRKFSDLTRTFPDVEPITVVTFSVQAAFGSADFLWVLSQPAVMHFTTHVDQDLAGERADRTELEHLAQRIPMEFVVRLGNANIHLSELVNLQVGDILLLDQRVSEPMFAEVEGTIKFQGRPGRIGANQAFQIVSHVTPDTS